MAIDQFKILFLGDIVGNPGRQVISKNLALLKQTHKPEIIIANGENAAGGFGIEQKTAEEIFSAGVDVITLGNHVWARKELPNYLEKNSDRLLRPYNYPPGTPGKGSTIYTHPSGIMVGVVNLIGRVFMSDNVDCPFQAINKILENELKDCQVIFIDFHAETTSEKSALGYFVDGKATVVVGTHTHVQTADEKILPNGTAFISDVGMCGPADGVIGVSSSAIVQRFLTARPTRFDLAKGRTILNGVVVTCNAKTGKALNIERINQYHE